MNDFDIKTPHYKYWRKYATAGLSIMCYSGPIKNGIFLVSMGNNRWDSCNGEAHIVGEGFGSGQEGVSGLHCKMCAACNRGHGPKLAHLPCNLEIRKYVPPFLASKFHVLGETAFAYLDNEQLAP